MKKINKWLRNKIIGFCEFMIIMSKTTIKSIQLIDKLSDMDDNFKSKLKNSENEKN